MRSTKQQTIDDITADIKDVIFQTHELRASYHKILDRLLAEPDVCSSDFDPIGIRVFQIFVSAQVMAVDAITKNMPIEFMQHLSDHLEVYALSYKIGNEQKQKLEQLRAAQAERQRPTDPGEEDTWPELVEPKDAGTIH